MKIVFVSVRIISIFNCHYFIFVNIYDYYAHSWRMKSQLCDMLVEWDKTSLAGLIQQNLDNTKCVLPLLWKSQQWTSSCKTCHVTKNSAFLCHVLYLYLLTECTFCSLFFKEKMSVKLHNLLLQNLMLKKIKKNNFQVLKCLFYTQVKSNTLWNKSTAK